jgi:dihydrofolate reductase
MKVSLIVAMDAKRGIGKNNDLMWHLPADMNFFKETTKNQIVVMGRRNYDSIPEKYRPLPNRLNVILTRNKEFQAENCLVFNSLKDCLTHFENENERKVFIIGGGEIYKMALDANCLDEMFITYVDGVFDADTFFPVINPNEWKLVEKEYHPKDDKHQYDFTYETYLRKM